MSRVLIGNLPPGTTIRNIDDFCSPFGRLLYVDVKNQGNNTLACVEYDSVRNSQNLVRARHGYNFNGYTVQLKVMSDDSGSGPFQVRDDSRRKKSPPPMWTKNNTQSNSRMFNNNNNNRMQSSSSNFDDSRGNNYYNNNNNSNRGSGPSSMDTSNLDYNQACRIVYERFINEGFNPQLAKERTLEFVRNMQGGNNQGFNNNNSDYYGQAQGMNSNNSNYFGQAQGMNNNSDYFGQDQGMNMNSNNFGNNFDNFNGNQNWGGNNFPGNQESFPNSNWGGNSNGPNNQQMPSSWGGGRGVNLISYPTQGDGLGRSRGNRNGMPAQSGWNSGGNRIVPKGRVGGVINENTVPPRGARPVASVDHESYLKSASIRKKIEFKITSGISTPRDLKNLQFHTQIMDDYERNARLQKKAGRKNAEDEHQKLQRYKSALGIVQKFKKLNQAQISPEDKKSFISSKAIVDEYEKAISSAARMVKGPVVRPAVPVGKNYTSGGAAVAAYERKKQQLIKESKKNYPYDFRPSGAVKRKMRSLVSVGIEMNEAKLLALHSSLVVRDIINMKNAIKKPTVADKSKQLVPVGTKPKPGAAKPKKTAPTKAKPTTTKPQPGPAEPDNSVGRWKDMSKKERDSLRSANRIVQRYETKNADIDSLTDKDIVRLRMLLKRLQTFHEKFEMPLRETKFDVLLTEKYDKKEGEKDVKTEDGGEQEEVVEEGNGDEVAEGDEEAGDEAEVEEAGEEEAEEDEPMGEEEEQEEEQ